MDIRNSPVIIQWEIKKAIPFQCVVKENLFDGLPQSWPTRRLQPVSTRFWRTRKGKGKPSKVETKSRFKGGIKGRPDPLRTSRSFFLRLFTTITIFGRQGTNVHRSTNHNRSDRRRTSSLPGPRFVAMWLTSLITNRFKPDPDRWYLSCYADVTETHHAHWQL